MKHLYVNTGTGTYFDLHRVSITNELKLLVHYSFSYNNVNIHMYIYMNKMGNQRKERIFKEIQTNTNQKISHALIHIFIKFVDYKKILK